MAFAAVIDKSHTPSATCQICTPLVSASHRKTQKKTAEKVTRRTQDWITPQLIGLLSLQMTLWGWRNKGVGVAKREVQMECGSRIYNISS